MKSSKTEIFHTRKQTWWHIILQVEAEISEYATIYKKSRLWKSSLRIRKKPFFLSWRPIEKCVWGLPPCQPAKTCNMELISYTNYVSGHTMDLNGHFSSLNVPCLQFGFSFAYFFKKMKTAKMYGNKIV